MKENLLYKWFGKEGILEIIKEYQLPKNKRVDLFVETERTYKLIEIKTNLNSYDLGQLMTYKILFEKDKKNNNKQVKLYLLYYYNCGNLELTNEILKNFNIDIILIDCNKNELPFKKNIKQFKNINSKKEYYNFENLENDILLIQNYIKKYDLNKKRLPSSEISNYLNLGKSTFDRRIKPVLEKRGIIKKINTCTYIIN